MTDGKTLQIPQALAAAQDSEHRNQQQLPGRKPNPAPHSRIWDRPQITDQIEIGCGRSAFKHGEEAIPQTSAHADSPARMPVTDFESTLHQGRFPAGRQPGWTPSAPAGPSTAAIAHRDDGSP